MNMQWLERVPRPRGFISSGFGGHGGGGYLTSSRGLLGGRRQFDDCYDCNVTYDGLHICGACIDKSNLATAQLQHEQYGCNCSYCDFCDDYGYTEYVPSRSALQSNSLAGILMPNGYGGNALSGRRRGLGLLGGSIGGGLGALGGYGGLGSRRMGLTRGHSYCGYR